MVIITKSNTNQPVLIVDDEESIRISLEYLLKKEKYKVTAVPNARLALKELEDHNYGVVLTDIILEGSSGVELLKKIKKKYPKVLVLLMTGYESLNSAIDALRLGATDYLIKPCSRKVILSSIKKAINNKKANEKKSTKFDSEKLKIKSGEKPLTKKELEVFEYLFYGLKLDAIASNLNVTLPTIKFHLKNLYRKLGIKGRREILLAYQDN